MTPKADGGGRIKRPAVGIGCGDRGEPKTPVRQAEGGLNTRWEA